MKKNIYRKDTVIQILILCSFIFVGFCFRLGVFDIDGNNSFHVDIARDYLVSRHIIAYQEFPLTGVDNYLGSHGSSPLYTYVISGLLLIKNHILFPGLVNVILQALLVVVVFLLTKELFDKHTAYLSCLFYTFFDAFTDQGLQMWQPHIMQIFFISSLCALVYGYTRAKISYVYISEVLFVFAMILHNSVWAIIPVYFVAVVLTLIKNKKTTIKVYTVALSVPILLVLCAYSSNLYFYFFLSSVPAALTAQERLYLPPEPLPLSIGQIFDQTIQGGIFLFSYFFEGTLENRTVYTYFAILLLIGMAVFYAFNEVSKQKKQYVLFLLSAIAFMIIAVGFIKLQINVLFPVRYLTPAFVPLCIVASVFFVQLYKKDRLLKVCAVILMLLILFRGSMKVPEEITSFVEKITSTTPYQSHPIYIWGAEAGMLANAIRALSFEGGPIVPFDIRTFEKDYELFATNDLLWTELERILGVQLTHLDSTSFRGYSSLRTPEHMFLRCIKISAFVCTEVFNEKYAPQYRIDTVLYESSETAYLHAQKM